MTKDSESGDGGNSGSGGLLSKVVKFVKSPTTHWSDLDRPEVDNGDSESRLALKEMIERKRRNDFVRNREFDMLRKMRRRETLRDDDALPGQASFYPSSQPANTGERARTLKKIDEIEAQMSTAWFKRKGGNTHEAGLRAVNGAAPPALNPQAYDQTEAVPLSEPDEPAPAPAAQAFAPTERLDYAAFEADLARVRADKATGAPVGTSAARADGGLDPLFPDGQFLGEMPELQVEPPAPLRLDPEIEEAAIRFANGDAAGAEAGLLELLSEGGLRENDLDTWLTLFDLYRSTSAHEKFDDTALHFAARFGRSAPQWGSGGHPSSDQAPLSEATPTNRPAGRFHWVCPSTMGVQSLAALNATMTRNPPPWRVDWRHIKTIEPSALKPLIEVIKRWADAPVRLKFLGSERLLQVLVENSPTDNRATDPHWWEARLAVLRVMGEMDEFELVALNYCVTYEVSPPAWEEPRNSFDMLSDEGDTMVPDEPEQATPQVGYQFGPTDVMSSPTVPHDEDTTRGELSGELVGSAEAALKTAVPLAPAAVIELDCRQLLRVDFAAAGDLLNWSMTHNGDGRTVTFTQVPRLVAAFFGVIGITEAARVVPRSD